MNVNIEMMMDRKHLSDNDDHHEVRWRVAGLMSGTSLDGLDVVLCELVENSGKWSFVICHGTTLEFPDTLRQRLIKAPSLNALEFVALDLDFGAWCGQRLKALCVMHQFEPVLVASHGHTVFHQPHHGITCQIGNGHALAINAGIPVVSDFRTGDVVAGGQGAPLVPMGDHLLFPEFSGCLNLGGIANVSALLNHQRMAFDIVPANMVLNHLSERLHLPFDSQGSLAAEGVLIPELLAQLNQWAYFQWNPPKSLAREQVENTVFPLLSSSLRTSDLLKTYTIHMADQIALVLNQFPPGDILVTGGGANNTFLVDMLHEKCKRNLVIPDSSLVDFKEALVFALLGILRWTHRTNIFASVTGAPEDHSSGVIYLPPLPLL